MSILKFVKENNKNVIEINFVLQKEYKNIFDDGFSVDNIVKEHNNKRFFFVSRVSRTVQISFSIPLVLEALLRILTNSSIV